MGMAHVQNNSTGEETHRITNLDPDPDNGLIFFTEQQQLHFF